MCAATNRGQVMRRTCEAGPPFGLCVRWTNRTTVLFWTRDTTRQLASFQASALPAVCVSTFQRSSTSHPEPSYSYPAFWLSHLPSFSRVPFASLALPGQAWAGCRSFCEAYFCRAGEYALAEYTATATLRLCAK